MNSLPAQRVRQLISRARQARLLVIGDLMLDEFIWGNVRRISPEAPVPVVDYDHESCMPGGAANVARNLTSLSAACDLIGLLGKDEQGRNLKRLLRDERVSCEGLIAHSDRPT